MKSVRLAIIFWSAASGATQPAPYLHSPISGPGRAPQLGSGSTFIRASIYSPCSTAALHDTKPIVA